MLKITTDHVLIILAVAVVTFGFIGKDQIYAEYQFFTHAEAFAEQAEILEKSIYYPLSQSESIVLINNYLEQKSKIQAFFAKSIIAKLLIDPSEDLVWQEELRRRESLLAHDEDVIDFFTIKQHRITAHPQFSKEQLLQCASVLDNTFTTLEPTPFAIDFVDEYIVIYAEMPKDYVQENKNLLQGFAEQVSKEIFTEAPVVLSVPIGDSMEFFPSESPTL